MKVKVLLQTVKIPREAEDQEVETVQRSHTAKVTFIPSSSSSPYTMATTMTSLSRR